MQTLQGIAVSPGVAIGEALVLDTEGFRIPRRLVARDAVEDELGRYAKAQSTVAEQISANRDSIAAQLGSQYGAIFSAHLQMLQDPNICQEIEGCIRQQRFSAPYAIHHVYRRYATMLRGLENQHLAERAHDLIDLEKRLLGSLLGKSDDPLRQVNSPIVLIAHDLTPSETARLDRNTVLGFATEVGGKGGHTAIVAEALEIPAIVGLGKILNSITSGQTILIDGNQGLMIIDPDQETLDKYKTLQVNQDKHDNDLQSLTNVPAETRDGVRILLTANVEFPSEAESCIHRGADGIGLYRTEFLYLGVEKEPSEEEQFQAYQLVAQKMAPRPVVIRTLDLGADKMPGVVAMDDEERNPFLGVRSIRLSLRNLPFFRIQLRAILRASISGNIEVMFPMITTLDEFRRAKLVLKDVMEDLEDEGIPFDRQIKVGMMVEVPSTVLMLDRFVKEVDFISIGTNDLIQYALAVDRGNKEVAELYKASDPAVLRLLKHTIDVAVQNDIPVNMCGQMCGTPSYTILLLGLGLREMSVRPSALLEIKKICRTVSIEQCQRIANAALQMDTAREIDRYLTEELRKIVPDIT